MGSSFNLGGGLELDYVAGTIPFVHNCAGGCGRTVGGNMWCTYCAKRNKKYQLYSGTIKNLAERGHRCGSCGAWFGGCHHTFWGMMLAIEEKWPMITNLDKPVLR